MDLSIHIHEENRRVHKIQHSNWNNIKHMYLPLNNKSPYKIEYAVLCALACVCMVCYMCVFHMFMCGENEEQKQKREFTWALALIFILSLAERVVATEYTKCMPLCVFIYTLVLFAVLQVLYSVFMQQTHTHSLTRNDCEREHSSKYRKFLLCKKATKESLFRIWKKSIESAINETANYMPSFKSFLNFIGNFLLFRVHIVLVYFSGLECNRLSWLM